VAAFDELISDAWQQGDAILLSFDFFGDTNDHKSFELLDGCWLLKSKSD
jgi:hypothetical protein